MKQYHPSADTSFIHFFYLIQDTIDWTIFPSIHAKNRYRGKIELINIWKSPRQSK